MPDATPTAPPAPAPAWVVSLERFVFDKVLGSINGAKTYLAAAGLLGLALYDLSVSDFAGATQNAMAALGAAGLRHAITKS